MAAVAMKYEGCEVMWWDKRRKITIAEVNSSFGFILNLPSQSKVGGVSLPFKTKHWLAIRKLGENIFYNLDSKLEAPQAIGDSQKLVEYLMNHLAEENCELFIVNFSKPCTLAEEEDTN
jgi:josephin